jgi:hypothetical protein
MRKISSTTIGLPAGGFFFYFVVSAWISEGKD